MHEVISERHKKESIINGRWRGARCCCAVVFPDSQIPRFPDLVRESLDGWTYSSWLYCDCCYKRRRNVHSRVNAAELWHSVDVGMLSHTSEYHNSPFTLFRAFGSQPIHHYHHHHPGLYSTLPNRLAPSNSAAVSWNPQDFQQRHSQGRLPFLWDWFVAMHPQIIGPEPGWSNPNKVLTGWESFRLNLETSGRWAWKSERLGFVADDGMDCSDACIQNPMQCLCTLNVGHAENPRLIARVAKPLYSSLSSFAKRNTA